MAKGSKTGAVVILGILAVAGLGLSGYMFINDQFLGENEHTHEGNELLAIWEFFGGNGADYYIYFQDNQLPQSEYFNMTDSNTTLNLNYRGWYRLTIRTAWTGLSVADNYYFLLTRNGLSYVNIYNLNGPTDTTEMIDQTVYVHSDGDDAFRFHCYSAGVDVFSLASNQYYNQMTLEYVEDV